MYPLQPDITAPGLNILAAWSGASPVTKAPGDNRFVKYNIESGTSMSCPHVSAVASLLKALHPDWSTAAIRSAIMTSGIYHFMLHPYFYIMKLYLFNTISSNLPFYIFLKGK